jgi:hypothetical protein
MVAELNRMAPRSVRPPALLPRLRRFVEGLGPNPSLLILAVPASLVEPLKLAALAIAGEGHWITGTVMIVCAYCTSLLLVERLFVIVRPKLLTLRWFARLWSWLVAVRVKIAARLGLKRKNPGMNAQAHPSSGSVTLTGARNDDELGSGELRGGAEREKENNVIDLMDALKQCVGRKRGATLSIKGRRQASHRGRKRRAA